MTRSRWIMIVLAGVGVFVLAAVPARAVLVIDEHGQVTREGQVLGEGDSGGSSESSGPSESSGSGPSGGGQEETKTEVRTTGENRVMTETKEGETKTEVRQNGVRVKMEQKNGRVEMKLETKEGEDIDVSDDHRDALKPEPEGEPDEDLLTVKEREDAHDVTIGTTSGQFVIKRRGVGAVANLPLSIDLSTNTLSVTTPAGTRAVTVLPDQAVQNMLAANVLDTVQNIAGFTPDAQHPELEALSSTVRLSQDSGGSMIYEISGLSNQKALGLFPVRIRKTAVVSAETGELLRTEESASARFLDLISR